MILVDTSIWIDHFHKSNAGLVELLNDNQAFTHPLVVGELTCGRLRQRSEILPLMQLLPYADQPSFEEMLQFVEKRKIFGQGIGWIDANLLASALLSKGLLWTRDKSLLKIANSMHLSYSP